MRVLYIATSFPKPNKGATIYTDLAEALNKVGHNVTVVVSEQARNLNKTQIEIERGLLVLRVVTGNYYDVTLFEKGVTTLKLPFLMKKGIKRFLTFNSFDFILYEAPPITNANLIRWAKKKFKCPSYLMLKDIFPQNAVDIEIIKKRSFVYRFFKQKEKKLYESADFIGCMSNANRKYILDNSKELQSDKVEIFPNTKKITANYKCKTFNLREKYSIPKDACVFLFGGNMGKPQYIELLSKAVIDCKNDKHIFFLFIGRGTERYKLENTIYKYSIKNSIVIENLPRKEYEEFIKEIDVGLIILDPRFSIPNYPSRILSYMEFAKPVLAATDYVSDLKDLIKEARCGEWVWSGDKDNFVNIIKNFSQKECLDELGINGRKYIEANLTVDKSVKILEKHFSR